VVLEELSERLGTSLDARGTAVLAMGSKENLKVPYTLLHQVGIAVYVLADGDADAAQRKHPQDPDKQKVAAASHKDSSSCSSQAAPSLRRKEQRTAGSPKVFATIGCGRVA
jgi:predicted ATP-dependent endonuclease of OLD family